MIEGARGQVVSLIRRVNIAGNCVNRVLLFGDCIQIRFLCSVHLPPKALIQAVRRIAFFDTFNRAGSGAIKPGLGATVWAIAACLIGRYLSLLLWMKQSPCPLRPAGRTQRRTGLLHTQRGSMTTCLVNAVIAITGRFGSVTVEAVAARQHLLDVDGRKVASRTR
jgi:hypothetical protein